MAESLGPNTQIRGVKSCADAESKWLEFWAISGTNDSIAVTIYDDTIEDEEYTGYAMVLDWTDAENLRDALIRWLGWPDDDDV